MLRVIFIFLIGLQAASATIKLNVNYVRKKNLDDKLVLSTELHEAMIIYDGETRVIDLKSNIKLMLTTQLLDNFKHVGPVPLFKVKAKLFRLIADKESFLAASEKRVELGKQILLSFVDTQGYSIELAVRPEIL